MKQLLWGALAMACWVAGLFFWRFWRDSRDRLFVFFCCAFWVLALDWIALALLPEAEVTLHYIYAIRLLAFALIIAGIVDKNRRA
jgi:hypothetical protein